MLLGIDASSRFTALTILSEEGNYIKSKLIIPDKKLVLEERGLIIIKELLAYVKKNKITKAAIEYSAFGAKGRVVDLSALNGGIIYGLKLLGIPVSKFAPTSIKKFATTSGRADKDLMKTNTPPEIISQFKAINNKIDDLVDSYWIAKFLYSKSNV